MVIEQSEWLDDGLNHQCLSTTNYEYITETQYSSERRNQYERFQYDLIEHTTLPEDAHTAIIQLVQEQQDSQVIRRKALKGHKNHFYNANGRQLLKKSAVDIYIKSPL
ncbi:hypothetical protein RZ760_004305 [Providencia rettgeri]|nr:hypothetical protein [Providencia rettgeri]